MKLKYLGLIGLLVGFNACNDPEDVDRIEPEAEVPALSANGVDFSNYVAVGNSLTAGYTDGALFKAGQENSMTNMLATKFSLVGGSDFTQPLTNDNYGGLTAAGTPITEVRLVFDGAGPIRLDSLNPAAIPTTDIALNNPKGPFNNMGVPGAKAIHLVAPGYGSLANVALGLANPYFVRMTGETPNATVLEMAMAQNPTFFTLWAGNNDVLGYATTGGDGTNPITPTAMFEGAFGGIVAGLTSGNAKGVVANIPYVTSIPHFTTVPHNPLDPTNEAFGPQIPTLNATFAGLNQAFAFLGMPERSIVFAEDAASAVVIHDETLPNIAVQLNKVLQGGGMDAATAGVLSNQFAQSRQATAEDLLLLPVSGVIAKPNVEYYTALVTAGVPAATAGQLSVQGITFPLADKWVLLPSEQEELKTATDAFNAIIKAKAEGAGLAFLDANDLMQQLATTGFSSGGFTLQSDLVTGGAFSLDGVHPTARGYALLANQFLKAIDETYGSNFEDSQSLFNLSDYPTNYSATLQ